MKNWALWAVIGGLGIDVADALTAKAGTTGGIFYGPTGYLKSFNLALPGASTPGVAIAVIGAAGLAFNQFTK